MALSGFQRPMIVAMGAVRMMQVAADAIIDMVAMRYRLVAAAGPMHMIRGMAAATVIGRAALRVIARHVNHVLVDMIPMRVMQMSVVQIVDMAGVVHRRMAAFRPVPMRVVGMGLC